jgi:signal-induced proliferation-associated 1 like protein 3
VLAKALFRQTVAVLPYPVFLPVVLPLLLPVVLPLLLPLLLPVVLPLLLPLLLPVVVPVVVLPYSLGCSSLPADQTVPAIFQPPADPYR